MTAVGEVAVGALIAVVLMLAGLAVVVMAVANLRRETGRDEFGRPGQAGPTPARDLVDLAGREVPDGR